MAVGKDTGKDEGKAKDKDNLVKTSGVARASRLTVAYRVEPEPKWLKPSYS